MLVALRRGFVLHSLVIILVGAEMDETRMSQSRRTDMFDLVVIGDIGFNTSVTNRGCRTTIGGGAYHAAVGASLHSRRVGVVATVGDDIDLRSLARMGVDLQGIVVVPSARSARFRLEQDSDGSRAFSQERGAADFAKIGQLPESYLRARHIHLPSCPPLVASAWVSTIRTVASGSPTVSVDTFESYVREYATESASLVQSADLVFLNYEELAELKDQIPDYEVPKPYVLKMGAQGAAFVDDSDEWGAAPTEVPPVVDTTGAGDVLAGALLAQLAQSVDTGVALEAAVDLATRSVGEWGVEHVCEKS